MTQVQKLQALLIERLQHITNTEILKALKVLTDDKVEEVYQLSERELEAIKRADEDIKNGRLYTNEEVFAGIDKWLSEKQK